MILRANLDNAGLEATMLKIPTATHAELVQTVKNLQVYVVTHNFALPLTLCVLTSMITVLHALTGLCAKAISATMVNVLSVFPMKNVSLVQSAQTMFAWPPLSSHLTTKPQMIRKVRQTIA